MLPLSGSSVSISPEDKQWKTFYFRVTPKDIDHLKLLAGVPNDTAAHPLYKKPLKRSSTIPVTQWSPG